jgi:hypothetical protein
MQNQGSNSSRLRLRLTITAFLAAFAVPSYATQTQVTVRLSIAEDGSKSSFQIRPYYDRPCSFAMNTVKMSATIQSLQAMLVFPDKHEQYAKILERVQGL